MSHRVEITKGVWREFKTAVEAESWVAGYHSVSRDPDGKGNTEAKRWMSRECRALFEEGRTEYFATGGARHATAAEAFAALAGRPFHATRPSQTGPDRPYVDLDSIILPY